MPYITAAMINAVVTSNTECCLISIVDKMIEMHKTNEQVRIPFFFSRCALFITAIWQPRELYTWMLGQRFVGVSVR